MADFEYVDASESNPELLEQIRAIHEVVGRFLQIRLEEFEAGFLRTDDPQSQVDLWSDATAAWIAYHEEYLNDQVLPDVEEQKLISALVAISAGVDDVSKLGVPPEVGQQLLACYDGLDEE